MKIIYYRYVFAALALFGLSSCFKELDVAPTNDITAEVVYQTPQGYKQAFAKVYASYALTGNGGPGDIIGDIQGIDAGTSDFFRLYWTVQELPTDEAVVSWGDPGIPDFHNMSWSASNVYLKGLYYRSLYQITLANDFIRQSEPETVQGRGITGEDAEIIAAYQAEARFLRAYQYWVLLDIFGHPPFVTEADMLGSVVPEQLSRSELFEYIESELLSIEPLLTAARSNEYGRADQGAVWALLARLYLNAEVYTGTQRYSDALDYAQKVIDAGYQLSEHYPNLMLADNKENSEGFILTINYDGLNTQGYGGTTFLTHAAVGGSMPAADFGINGGWAGLRTTKNLPLLFPDPQGRADKRAQFWTQGQSLEINDVSRFNDGYAITKFRNVDQQGNAGKSLDFSDSDMPIFRLAEQYLIYAEAVLRGGNGGSKAQAISYINRLRERAYENNRGTVSDIDLDFVLDERARELYWEGFRRTDLIRYGRFVSGDYLWPWKGGAKAGRAVASYRNLYPIPQDDITANPNLEQNPGY